MAIAGGILLKLFDECIRQPFAGSALCLGKQEIHLNLPGFIELCDRYGLSPPRTEGVSYGHNEKLAAAGYISDVFFFNTLGFSEVKSLDISTYENADFQYDLNGSNLPNHLEESFDTVFDVGTLEHIFHTPNALNNIFKMLKVGGRIIHSVPSSNHIDHGFYMFSPSLFWAYYKANGWQIETLQVYRYTLQYDTEPWIFVDYLPGSLDHVAFGGLDTSLYGIFCIATKMKTSSGDKLFQQPSCEMTWSKKDVLSQQDISRRKELQLLVQKNFANQNV